MSGQYFGESTYVPANKVEEPDKGIDNLEENTNHFSNEEQVGDIPVPENPIAENDLPVETTPLEDVSMNATTIPYDTPPPVDEIHPEETVVSRSVSYSAPMDEPMGHETPVTPTIATSAALLTREDSDHFRTRWTEIQGKFVDDPQSAVKEADALVTEVVESISRMFASEHSSLESQWNAGDIASTEDLRKALQHYRSFFNRLVV